jgi:hypothetical protein
MRIQIPPAEQIVSALRAVPERSMRTHLLIEKLCALSPEDVAQLLQTIITEAAGRRGDYGLALEALSVPQLTLRAGNAFMSDVYVCARQSGFEELLRILSRSGPGRAYDEKQETGQDEIPSGVRVSMARSGNRQKLACLLADTNPLVIRALLKNPSLTESDVLKLSSRRPAAADVQREVFHSRKWSARYSVKKALVLNPYTPTDIGMKIVHMLMIQDLRSIAESRDLHPWLCETALQYVRAEGIGSGEDDNLQNSDE